jgi:hypothetical protein
VVLISIAVLGEFLSKFSKISCLAVGAIAMPLFEPVGFEIGTEYALT